MKICMVNSFFPPWRGGAETYTYNLAKHLVSRGHEVEVYCASPPRKPGSYDIEQIKLTCLPITTWLYGTPITTDLPSRLLETQADVIHAGFPSPYNAFCTSLASWTKKTPSILTWHNDLPPVTAMARMLVHAHNGFVLPIYIRTFRRIISTSKTYAVSSDVLTKHVEKLAIVPNGVDCKKFRPDIDSTSTRKKLNLDNQKIILFVGALTRWHSYKGLDVLIRAIAMINQLRKDMVLVVVGEGGLKPVYQRLASDMNLAKNVLFAGNVSDQELPYYYAMADLLVLPSKDRSEGFGLTILEANACGKPVIGSTVGGIPDVIRHESNGLLIPPNSPGDLSKAIARLVEEEGLRREMGRNARRFAEEHDWSRVAEETERVYREVSRDRM